LSISFNEWTESEGTCGSFTYDFLPLVYPSFVTPDMVNKVINIMTTSSLDLGIYTFYILGALPNLVS
jgi:hypothetical protein